MRAVPDAPPLPRRSSSSAGGTRWSGQRLCADPAVRMCRWCHSERPHPAATSPLDGCLPRETRHLAAPLLSLCACALVHATRRPLRASLARKVVPCGPRDVAARDLPQPPPGRSTPPRASAVSPPRRRAGACSSPRPGPHHDVAAPEAGRELDSGPSPHLSRERPSSSRLSAPTPAHAIRVRGLPATPARSNMRRHPLEPATLDAPPDPCSALLETPPPSRRP